MKVKWKENVMDGGGIKLRARRVVEDFIVHSSALARKSHVPVADIEAVRSGDADNETCLKVQGRVLHAESFVGGLRRVPEAPTGVPRQLLLDACKKHGVGLFEFARISGEPVCTCRRWLDPARDPDQALPRKISNYIRLIGK